MLIYYEPYFHTILIIFLIHYPFTHVKFTIKSNEVSLLEGFNEEMTHLNCVGGELLIAFFVTVDL